MKNLIKNTIFTLTLLSITSCGFGNNLLLIGYNLKSFSPHKHKVTEKIEKSFPENGLGIVSINFKINDGKDGVNTIWRRINPDKTFSKRITLTYVEVFKRGRVRVALEPGEYFLDGVRYSTRDRRYIQLGSFNKMYSNEQKGWDTEKNKPHWFSFKAVAGKELNIPDINISTTCSNNRFTCRGDSVKININTENSKNGSYHIGDEAK